MESTYLLGIDLGAQSAKVVLIDRNGQVKGLGQVGYDIQQPYPSWAETDPEVWWQAVVKGLGIALQQAKIKPAEIAGVGISNMCPSLVTLDKDKVS